MNVGHLAPKASPTWRSIKIGEWPAADRTLYEKALSVPKTLLGPRSTLGALRPATRETDAYGYGTWLYFLEKNGLLDPEVAPGARITASLVSKYIECLENTDLSGKSIAMYFSGAYRTLKYLHPELDWEWLYESVACVYANAEPVVDKHGLPSVEELCRLGLDLIEAAEKGSKSRLARAVAYRNGLMILLMACRPLMRPKNLRTLAFGTQVVRHGSRYHLVFKAADRKAHKPVTAPLGEKITAILDHYGDVHHPILAARTQTHKAPRELWLSEDGGVLGRHRISAIFASQTSQRFGRVITPHMFRHAAASTYWQHAPEHIHDVPYVVDHGSLAMSEKYVWYAGQNAAIHKLNKAVCKLEAE